MTGAVAGRRVLPPGARRPRWARRAAVALGAVVVAVALTLVVDGPADPVLAPAATATDEAAGTSDAATPPGCDDPPDAAREPFEGFGEVAIRVTAADGSVAFDGCAHLAATPEARAQGLMGRRSLGGYDAMVFRFDGPSTGGFYMFRTVLPLSIAFIDADGSVVSAGDMDPCPEADASACPTYTAAGPYVHAIEVPRGDLADLGIVPGATITFAEVGASS